MRKPFFYNKKYKHSGSNVKNEIKSSYAWPIRNERITLLSALSKSLSWALVYSAIVLVFSFPTNFEVKIITIFVVSGFLFGLFTVFISELYEMGFMIERIGALLLAAIFSIVAVFIANKFGAGIY